MNFEIFASYSHRDARFVKPLVKFLQPTGAPVFRDEDSIPPGTKWAVRIAAAIQDCRLLYLFWCNHSASSDEVRKEYEQALALNKDIVPVLLDDTPLPEALREYQWVDLRVALGAHEQVAEQRMSVAEGREQQRLDREEHGYKQGRDGYFGGNFARMGWQLSGDEYVRKVMVELEIPEIALHRAGDALQAHLSARIETTQ
jgi:hypothetical protein